MTQNEFLDRIRYYFNDRGLDLVVGNYWDTIRKTLRNASDYDYEIDKEFEGSNSKDIFTYHLETKGEVIATYAGKMVQAKSLIADIRYYVLKRGGRFYFNRTLQGAAFYSSCQYVQTKYRSQGIGSLLDLYKKVHSLKQEYWEFQVSHCREALHKYHKEFLFYSHSVPAFTITAMPGSGTEADKSYFINWVHSDDINGFFYQRAFEKYELIYE